MRLFSESMFGSDPELRHSVASRLNCPHLKGRASTFHVRVDKHPIVSSDPLPAGCQDLTVIASFVDPGKDYEVFVPRTSVRTRTHLRNSSRPLRIHYCIPTFHNGQFAERAGNTGMNAPGGNLLTKWVTGEVIYI